MATFPACQPLGHDAGADHSGQQDRRPGEFAGEAPGEGYSLHDIKFPEWHLTGTIYL